MASKEQVVTAATLAAAQKEADKQNTVIRKAVKALVLIIAGFSGLFLLKLISLLRKKKDGTLSSKEADSQISSLKEEWLSRTTSALEDGWKKGVSIGVNSAKSQGAKSASSDSIPDSILDSLKKDVKKTIDAAEKLLTESINSGKETDPDVKKILLRLQLSGEASLKNGIAEAVESELASPDTRKMWVATSKTPCSHCTRLHGMVRDWGEEFPHSFTGVYKLKVYGGVLLGPLRHPHCFCFLKAVPKEL